MKKTFLLIFLTLSVCSCNEERIYESNSVELLKAHYKFNNELKKLSIEYETLSFKPYQSFDYRKPDSLFGHNTIYIDAGKKQFYAYREAWFPGIFHFTLQEFQRDSLSVRFDDNGIILGKKVVNQDIDRIYQVKDEIHKLLDFQIGSNLFSYKNDSTSQKIYFENDKAIITNIDTKKDSINYTFSLTPIQLISVESRASDEKWEFDKVVKKDGFTYASRVTYFKDGEFRNQNKIISVKKMDYIPPERLEIPIGFNYEKESNPEPLNHSRLDKDIFLIKPIAGDRNVLIKINGKHITVFGAPISDRFSNQVIELINKEFPQKKIQGVYITHSHSDHIGGLMAYVDKNIPIIADEFTVQAIKAYLRFQKEIDKFKFTIIANEQLINGVQYFIPSNPHCLGQSFAYFIDSRVIYQGDFLEIPADNSIPSYISNTSLIFIDFLRQKNLQIERIVGHHRNNNISLETMNKYYKINKKE